MLMPPVNRALPRTIRQALYGLKRQYGCMVDIYKPAGSTSDPKTGTVTQTRTVHRVRRAPVLPVKITRELAQTISYISANKAFVTGGSYLMGSRTFIVDRKDARDLELSEDCWVVYNDRKYEIQSYWEFEVEAGWVIVGRELPGEVPEQVYELSADHLLSVESTAEAG